MSRLLQAAFLLLVVCLFALAQTEEPLQLKTADILLNGTLTTPANVSGPVPMVLFTAGSGPTDRNGNNPIPVGHKSSVKASSYKLSADSPAKLTIATLRYDKRGVGRSISKGLSEKELTFDTYIHDAARWIEQLKANKRFSGMIVAGHSAP